MQVAKRHEYLKTNPGLQTRIGVAVRASRERLGLSQEELGWRAGLHRTYITDIERGSRNLTLGSVSALARALEVSVAGLLMQADALGDVEGDAVAGLGEVVMVEDNAVDAQLALRAFQKAKFTNPVRTLRDGQAALDYLLGEGAVAGRGSVAVSGPALVLLDLHLPKVSGLEVLRRIKSEERTKGIPVVVLTASRLHRDVQECLALGAESYLVKPVGVENFRKTTADLNMNWALTGTACAAARTSKVATVRNGG
jgi:two-component system, response regulator